jgi:2-dehydro-3-deoxyphosphogluconate aldolase/(4S)-4-hydroxy-2-oxoglutarate aldolase
MQNITDALRSFRVVPVVVLEDSSLAHPLADALVEGGLGCAEITLRSDAALGAIASMAKRGDVLVGAGTVLNVGQAQAAVDAGARYIVSPGLSGAVVEWCQAHDMPIYPGVSSPTEIMAAIEFGLTVLKFFPAEPNGGMQTLKSLASVFTELNFLPTGGITLANLGDYLAHPQVAACGGSWLVHPQWLREGHFDKVAAETRRTIAAISPNQ